MSKKLKLYTCGVDWQYHLGEDHYGVTFFFSIESLKANKKCWVTCGIVELDTTFPEPVWVAPQDLKVT